MGRHIDAETRQINLQHIVRIAQLVKRLIDHPTIQGGHHLVALCRRHEFFRQYQLIIFIEHAHKNLIAAAVLVVIQRPDGLRMKDKAVVDKCRLNTADLIEVTAALGDTCVNITKYHNTPAPPLFC